MKATNFLPLHLAHCLIEISSDERSLANTEDLGNIRISSVIQLIIQWSSSSKNPADIPAHLHLPPTWFLLCPAPLTSLEPLSAVHRAYARHLTTPTILKRLQPVAAVRFPGFLLPSESISHHIWLDTAGPPAGSHRADAASAA